MLFLTVSNYLDPGLHLDACLAKLLGVGGTENIREGACGIGTKFWCVRSIGQVLPPTRTFFFWFVIFQFSNQGHYMLFTD